VEWKEKEGEREWCWDKYQLIVSRFKTIKNARREKTITIATSDFFFFSSPPLEKKSGNPIQSN
jgi:hypothetical protein